MSTAVRTPMPERPYKFLDFYREPDAPVFFGRSHEIEILLADIIATRLVVLFARTGTGKSSLIHAGIRPRLHALDYRTALARGGGDPSVSIINALTGAGLLRDVAEGPIAERLKGAVQQQQRPIVVFVDQFEEFFLSPISSDARKAFLKQIGEIYRTPRSGVHLVFSLREDFLAEMDIFRDEIPTIFQKESQLRLRPFTAEQARDAVEGPSHVFEPRFRYEQGLVDVLVADLPREGEHILPVSVQIVCDSLWRKRDPSGTITKETYNALGGAKGILAARVVEDLSALEAESLLVVEQLIPHLRTPEWTKQPRTILELQSLTGIDEVTLRGVVNTLESLQLVRNEQRESEQVVEWVSDYISALSRELAPTLIVLWVVKLREGWDLLPITPERLTSVLNDAAVTARLSSADWYYLLYHSAHNRDTLGLWFSRAVAAGQDPWDMLGAVLQLNLSAAHADRVLLFLGEFEDGPAIDILAKQVKQEGRARTALRALGATRSKRALEYLRPALDDPELHGVALDALQSLGQKDALELAEKARKESRSWRDLFFGGRARTLRELSTDWVHLIRAMRDTAPLILIGPHVGKTRSILAAELARQFSYPFEDRENLDAVVEFLRVEVGEGWQKQSRLLESPEIGPEIAAFARFPAHIYVTTDPTNELERALTNQRKSPSFTTPTLHLLRITEVTSTRPLLMYARGAMLWGELPEQVHDDYETLALTVRRQLLRAKLTIPRVSIIAAGFDNGDRAPEAFRRGFAGNPQDVPLTVVWPPTEVENRDAESRVRRYFQTRAERERVWCYWGKPEEFIEELMTQLDEPR